MATPVEIAVRATGTAAAERAMGRLQSRVGGAARTMGKVAAVGAAAAGAAMIKMGADSVKAASDAQQSIGATRTVFGKYARDVIAQSNAAAKSVGLSANEYRELANVTGAMLSSAGTPLKKTTELTEDLTKRGADMAATFGGTAKEAIQAIGSLLRGEADPIEKYGVSIKQSDINARLAAKGLDELTGSARKQAEQQARVRLLFDQTSKSAGAFARESNTLAGQQQRLSAGWEDLKVKVGNALIPALTTVTTTLSDRVIPAISRMWDNLAPAREAIGRFAAGIGEIVSLIRDRNWSAVWGKVTAAARKAFSAAVEAAKTFLTQRLVPAIIEGLRAARQAWANRWSNFWKDPAKAYRRTESETDSFGRRMVDRLDGIGINAVLALMRSLRKMPELAAKEGIAVVSGLKQGLSGAPKLATAIGLSVISNLRSGLESGRAMAAAMGTNIVMGLIDGIQWMAQRAIDAAVGVVRNAIAAAKRLLGISSPSREFIKIGRATVEGFVVGLRRGRGKAGREAAKLMRTVLKAARDGARGLRRELRDLLSDRGLKGSDLAKGLRRLSDESRKLVKVAARQARVNQRLREARDRLRELRRESRDYAANVKNAALSYASITNLDAAFNPRAIAAAMRSRLEKLRQFSTLLDQLRAGGLNQASLDQLVQGGVEGGLAYADAIASGGADAIAELNDLQSEIAGVAGDVGSLAADNMYAAGIQAAQGLVEGLKAREKALDRVANRLARKLVAAIKKELGIKSPSRVFQQLGAQTVEGMRIGIEDGRAKRIGEVLARDLTTGFSKPELTARQVWDQTGGRDGEPRELRVRLTSQQSSQLVRGKELILDIDFARNQGVRARTF